MTTSDDPRGRRGFLKHVLLAMAGGVVVPVSAGAAPAGSPGRRSPASLPSVGQEVSTVVNVWRAPVKMSLLPGTDHPLPELNFVGVRRQRVAVGGADHVRLRTLDFEVRASDPVLGEVTLRLPDSGSPPLGRLEDRGDSGLRETWVEAPELVIGRLGDQEGPFVFQAREPFTCTADMEQWPPPPLGTNPDGSPDGGALYALHSPMVFTDGESTVEFTAFPARIGAV
ncbi:hypothetical protein [Saccharothrix sp. ALI-22-I]|uniref:hypothetical protein n=1 Tax=Saccharothrix sp. ALI-22-I TaxID=1933778 RepID=UPI00117A1C3D|nr:hypothetical protein [Saccharothrix sp. ALI-22-I]